jgi:hypothetical protein
LFEYICHKQKCSLGSFISPRRSIAVPLGEQLEKYREQSGHFLIVQIRDNDSPLHFLDEEFNPASSALAMMLNKFKPQTLDLPASDLRQPSIVYANSPVLYDVVAILGLPNDCLSSVLDKFFRIVNPKHGLMVLVVTGEGDLEDFLTSERQFIKAHNNINLAISVNSSHHDDLLKPIFNSLICIEWNTTEKYTPLCSTGSKHDNLTISHSDFDSGRAQMSTETQYDKTFYTVMHEGSQRSAQAVLPLLFERFKPKSHLDVGCGAGCWLQASQKLGVKHILGVDGQYVPDDMMLINKDLFQPQDLEQPLAIHGNYDLVSCLEVIEHLSEARGDALVEDLCRLGRVVLFSCAIPAQGGTNHIHEQFPSYWIPRFQKNGYHCYDFLRPLIWTNQDIEICYRQNILVFSKDVTFPNPVQTPGTADIIHPAMWRLRRHQINQLSLKLNELALTYYDKTLV